MNRRGHALHLVMVALTALSVLGAIAWDRIASHRFARRAEERRLQALWMARGSALAGRPGTRKLQLDGETVNVNTRVYRVPGGSNAQSEVTLPRFGTAHVDVTLDGSGMPTRWEERYDRTP